MSELGLHNQGMLRGRVEAERQLVRVKEGVFLDPKGDLTGLLVIWGSAWAWLTRESPPASGRGGTPAWC